MQLPKHHNHARLIDNYMLSLQHHLCKLNLVDPNLTNLTPNNRHVSIANNNIHIPYYSLETFVHSLKTDSSPPKLLGRLSHNDKIFVLGVSSDTLIHETSIGSSYTSHQLKLINNAIHNHHKASSHKPTPQPPATIESLRWSGQSYHLVAISQKGELIFLTTYSTEVEIAE
jgi:hypothetical protein